MFSSDCLHDRRRGLRGVLAALLGHCLVACLMAAETDFQGATHLVPFDEEAINYSKTPANGPIERLVRRIESGEARLKFDERQGYLPALLEALKIPANSQVLVFSKTSLQREHISPRNPRSIFFNDGVYVGFIPGAPLMEISAVDPKLGGVFYTLEQKPVEKPRFVRTDGCLECHASAKSMGVPGHLIRSFAVDEAGAVDLTSGTSLVNHRTPIADRWGGWYVTGGGDHERHRGNLFGADAFARHGKEPAHVGTLTNLDAFLDTKRYPAGTSDIVALMVLEHQTHMHNFITRLHYESMIHLQAYGHVNYLKNIITAFLKYLLFVDEAPLAGSIRGSREFTEAFAQMGPTDRRGRSLRQFDLRSRLFKHPCSYLIYSEAFDHVPEKTREQVYQRLWDILNGKDSSPEFKLIPASQREAIREILLETKSGLPACWKTEKD